MSSGSTLFFYNGYTFWKDSRRDISDNSQLHWHCSSTKQNSCKVVVTCYGTYVIRVRNEHNHPKPRLIMDQRGRYHKINDKPVTKTRKRNLMSMFASKKCDDFVQCVPTKKGHQILFKEETLPEWTSIYFVKNTENEMKCNLCDIILKVHEKSLELLEHLKVEHKDIYDLHKDNPEATVGFRIEFLHLNMLKDDGDPKTQPVLLGEVCETATEPIVEKVEETVVKPDETNLQYVVLDGKKRRRESSGPRKRSWVWKYFEKLSNIIYRCRLCNVVLSIKGCNSNNMNRHVRSRHPTVFKSEVTKRERADDVHMITSESDTPFAIKTEEIYVSDRDYEEVQDSPSQKLRRSWIWSYFDRVSSTQAQCKLCKRHICHGGNATGNMNRHLKMIHHKTACTYDQSWVWKVFEGSDADYYSCKICQYKCLKCSDIDKSMTSILNHLKLEHGVVSGDQIITGTDIEGEENT